MAQKRPVRDQKRPTKNHGCVVWSTCILWFISLLAITSSLVLFLCLGDILICTGTDIINIFMLLSGIVMLPTNLHMVYCIAQGKKIRYDSRVAYCSPLWLSLIWIIIINIIGAGLCIHRMLKGKPHINARIEESMANYRSSSMHKRFIDNLQWSLKCCGLNSYKDWFNQDWYDKFRDYEWESTQNPLLLQPKMMDSVPLSCCKSGSCISNYLTELGTASINKKGCSVFVHQLIMVCLAVHVLVFISVIILECCILYIVIKDKSECDDPRFQDYNVRQLMNVKEDFRPSSDSYMAAPEDSDDDVSIIYDYENY